ncbi:hypothetical protein KDA_73580 [Dictyobacter alpinus]|uniref:DUF998 domain-containing protein n=1 Tax=Dictyobacter alpinus TaxID=2014873 RepID=A0A402BKJ3_9CHLR|nr:DUF998 domain-containing protein [Dictyobacter alpinus]GCE31874.1 hypothetical protein KDA_73580 [Dictyobacter alpinus]
MAQSLTMTKPVSNAQVLAARLSIASGVLFVFLLLSLHVLEPAFDPTWRFISEYALGSFGWMMHLAFCLLATSLVSAGVAIFPYIRTVLGYLGLIILVIGAIGLFIAGIFTTDPIATSQEAATLSGNMHVFGASLDYTPVAALLLSYVLTRHPAWKPMRMQLFITAGITLVGMVAFMLLLPHDGKFGPGVLAGLCGRFLIVSYLCWLLTVGFYTLKLRHRAE